MSKTKDYLYLFFTFLIYSISSLFSKLASNGEGSLHFILFYGLSLFAMAVYAYFWQLILKVIPLNKAYPLKAITIVFSMVIGFLLFKEQITLKMIIACLFIFAGVFLVSKDE